MPRQRRAFSVSVYCRHEGSVLLIQHTRLQLWLPIGGELQRGETPLEAARRELQEETGFEHGVSFPIIHKVVGAPPGLLLYEEHDAGSKGLHLNFAFVAEVPSRKVRPNHEYAGFMWVDSMAKVPEDCPTNVRQALLYALAAGREKLLPATE